LGFDGWVSYTVPTSIPERLVAGDTWTWKDSFSDFPNSSWTLTTEVVGSSTDLGTFTASASGSQFLTTVAPATTASWAAGDYSYQQIITNDTTGERHVVAEGWLTVVADLATATSHDGRSHTKIVLDALEATIQGKASKDQLSYSIAGRSLMRMSANELITWEERYRARWAQELAELRRSKGLSGPSKIRTRFS